MSIYTKGFDVVLDFLRTSVSTGNHVTLTDDHIQYVEDDITIVIGFNSLRLLLVDNKKFASITMVPTEVHAGTLVIPCETKLALYNTDYRHEVSGLYISGAETFQMSTLYDFDFGILKEIMPKYLEVLEVLSTASKTEKKVHVPTLLSAIESVRKYNKMYEEE